MKSSTKELLKFLSHPIFYVPICLIFFLEIFLRTGIYDSFLKPQSYAANINRIKFIVKNSSIDPNVLVVGTSVPFQGLLLNDLNDYSKKDQSNLVFQSIATQGAFLVTQNMLLNYTLKDRENIKYIIHFADLDFPWQQRYDLELANRSMLSQFDITETISLLIEYKYNLKPEDYRFFYIKILTYQRDLRDFFLDPLGRFKSLSKSKKQFLKDYAFINNNDYALGYYGSTVEECINNATKGIPFFMENKQITDEPHRRAVLDTCKMANYDPYNDPGRLTWENLLYLRLNHLYQTALKKNIRIITILPPYSIFMQKIREEKKARFWIDTIYKINPNIVVIDHRFVLDDEKNLFYYYDTIHLNRIGAEKYTQIFYKDIIKSIK